MPLFIYYKKKKLKREKHRKVYIYLNKLYTYFFTSTRPYFSLHIFLSLVHYNSFVLRLPAVQRGLTINLQIHRHFSKIYKQ